MYFYLNNCATLSHRLGLLVRCVLHLTNYYGGDDWFINRESPEQEELFKESVFQYILFERHNFDTSDVCKVYYISEGCIMDNAHKMLKDELPQLEIMGSNADDAVVHYLRNKYLNG